MRKYPIALSLVLASMTLTAQDIRVYPGHWWTGMRHNTLKLLVRSVDKPIASPNMKVTSSTPGIAVRKVQPMQNPRYVQVTVDVTSGAKPGKHSLNVGGRTVPFELKQRDPRDGKTRVMGVDSRDLTYLMLPDRSANGDASNDAYRDLRDTTSDRNNQFARHGGDLKGVQDRLDHFLDLGVTAVWFTPVTENDMPRMREGQWDMAGYHGYWFTDHYAVDRRLGGNTAYRSLVDKAHATGLKVVFSSCYESQLGNRLLAQLASEWAPEQAPGLDTLRYFTTNILQSDTLTVDEQQLELLWQS